MSISVAMATYNGEKHLAAQLDSIIPQLSKGDEIVISDDQSTDGTLALITSYINQGAPIQFVQNPDKGCMSNFQNAISKCQNEFIYLCDQDDIWCENKVEVIQATFAQDPELLVIVSDLQIVDDQLNVIEDSFYNLRNSGAGLFKNIIKNSYIGCAMAFRAELVPQILPFPKHIPMHDVWIGLRAEKLGHVEFIKDKLILYRRHENNVTEIKNVSSLKQKLVWRFGLISALLTSKSKRGWDNSQLKN